MKEAKAWEQRIIDSLKRKGWTTTNDWGRDSGIGTGESAAALGHEGISPGVSGLDAAAVAATALGLLGGPIGSIMGAVVGGIQGGMASQNAMGVVAGILGLSPAVASQLGMGISASQIGDIPGLTGDDLGIAGIAGLSGGFGTADVGFGPIGENVGGVLGQSAAIAALGGFSEGRDANSAGQSGIAGLGDTSGYGGQGDSGMGGPGAAGVGGGGVGAGEGGGPAGASCCFIAGTQITMMDGLKNIEDVQPGDIVKSYNMLTTDHSNSIVGTTKTVTREAYYEIKFTSGEVLNVTDDHPLYTQYGWASINPMGTRNNPLYSNMDIGLLSTGCCVMAESKRLDPVVSITEVPGEVETYTLGDVYPNSNFFADGYLASNYAC